MAIRSTKATTITIKGLKAATDYVAQVGVIPFHNANGELIGGHFGPLLEFTTISDSSPPNAPSNLTATQKTRSIVLEWDAPTQNEDGTDLFGATGTNDFSSYRIDFFRTSSPGVSGTVTTIDTKYEFSRFFMQQLLGQNYGDVTFNVYSVDYGGNASTTPATTAFTTIALSSINLTGTSEDVSVKLEWTDQQIVNYYSIHRGAASGFTPDSDNQIGAVGGSDLNDSTMVFYDTPADQSTYYYVVVGWGWFGNSQTSNEVTGQTQGVATAGPDTDAPSVPSTPTITGGTHSFTIDHDLQKAGGGALEDNARFIFVYASETPSFTADETTRLGSIAIGDNTEGVSDTFTWVIDSSTVDTDIVYVKVRAGNKDGYLSTASAEASGIVNGAGYDYFKNLAVTNAKINDLDASKINADTAFVNDLFVESQLTVQSGGIVQTSGFVPDGSGGWRIDYTGLAEFQNAIVRGTMYADNGYLGSLTVQGNIVVSGSGSIASDDYSAGTAGWIIRADGTAELNEITARGGIYATSGELGNLNVINDLTLTTGDIKSGNYSAGVSGWIIKADGTAEFQDTYIRGEILATAGGIAGDFGVSGTLYTGGVDGSIRSEGPGDIGGRKVQISTDDFLQVYGLNSSGWTDTFWRVYTTDQDNFLVEQSLTGFDSGNSSPGLGLAVRTNYSQTLRMQAFHGTGDADDKQTLFIRVGNGDNTLPANKNWSIGSGSGTDGVNNVGYMAFVEPEQAFYFNTKPDGTGTLLNIYANSISGGDIYITNTSGGGGTLNIETVALTAPTGLTGFTETLNFNSDGTPNVDVTFEFGEVANAQDYEIRFRRL